MSKLFGLLINERRLVGHALHPIRDVFRISETESPHGFGWGIAYYQAQEVLTKRRPRHIGALDFYKRMMDVHGGAIVGHVRQRLEGRTAIENTQPFRFRNWTFAHRGMLSRFEQIRPWLLNALPNFLRRNIRGETDSEHLFQLFLSFLYDESVLDAHDLPAETAAEAVSKTYSVVSRWIRDAGGGEAEFNMLVTNGEVMVLAAQTGPAYYAEIKSITDCAVCRQPPDSWNGEPKVRNHENLKAVALVFDPPDGADVTKLQRVEPEHLAFCDQRSYKVFTLPLKRT